MNRLSFLIMVFFFAGCSSKSNNIYEWRGPNRSGIYSETGLMKVWPDEGPKLIWDIVDIGHGYGSPVVANDKILLLGTSDSISVLYCFNLDGKKLFETEVGNEWVVNFPGSRCTPTVAGDFVYSVTGRGDLACVDLKTGKLIWGKNYGLDFGGESPRFGYAESPLVLDNKIYCFPGGVEYNVVCLDRFSGDLIWSSRAMGERSAYNSMALLETGKMKILAAFSAYHLLGIDAENGKLLWTHEQLNTPKDEREPGKGDTHGNTVVYDGNVIYYIEGDGNGAVALQLSPDGSSVSQIWNNAMVDNYMGGFVKYGNYLFSCAYSKSTLVKVNARNGIVVDSLSIGRGSLIMADQKLYYYNIKGDIHLIDVLNDRFKVVSAFKIYKGDKEHFAHPVIDKGVIYIRHGNYLAAYQI